MFRDDSIGSSNVRCCRKRGVRGTQLCCTPVRAVLDLFVSLDEHPVDIVFCHRQGLRPYVRCLHVPLERLSLLEDVLSGPLEVRYSRGELKNPNT